MPNLGTLSEATVREASREKAITNNLRQIASAGMQYMLEEDADMAFYEEMAGDYFLPIPPIDTESYRGLVVHENGGVLAVESVKYGRVTYTY